MISGWAQEITLTIPDKQYTYLWEEILNIVEYAWEVNTEDITQINTNKYTIKTTYTTMCRYIDHNIIYIGHIT